MLATVDQLIDMYHFFNDRCFQNKLPGDVYISLHDSFTIPGRYDFEVDEYGHVTYHNISISRSFDWTLDQLLDVMLHEMIHEYIYYFGVTREKNPHGEVFQSMMNDLNQKMHRNVTIKQDLTKMKRAPGTSKVGWWFSKTFA